VNISNGAVGNALISNIWYDPSGNLLQQIQQGDGQVFTKSSYNGVNWITGTYRGYNPGGTSYNQTGGVSTDVIVTQSIPTFDYAGNIVSQATYDRLNDASTSATGALTGSIARVSYTASWFDGLDRPIANANYGAQTTAPSIPSTPPSSTSTLLVSSTSYDSAGRVYQATDPKGIVTQTNYDAANRKMQVIEDYGTGALNRTTNWTYTLDNLVATLEAVNATTGNQTTTYTYGTSNASSGVVRNDLLASVTYPDSVSDVVTYAYNRLGQQRTITDQRNCIRAFYYDPLGRQTNDCVTPPSGGVDTTVLQIGTAYEIRGMVQTITSYNTSTAGSLTGIVNQVQLTYNTFSQLVSEQQDHATNVSSSSPVVQYSYDTGVSSSNEIRLNAVTYPNGRLVSYNFTDTLDAELNRITSISDTSATLASYTYLGSGLVVRLTYPQPNVWLDLWEGFTGTFNGIDQWNRIRDQSWQNNITGTPVNIDRYQYGYDYNSNRVNKTNLVSDAAGTYLDETYTYDNLKRLTQMQRGNLSGGVITGTLVREMDYTLDATGNWPNYQTSTGGTVDLSQTRMANNANEITAIGGTPAWATPPAYDPAGNMTGFPQPAGPGTAFTATYDAWNRMVSVSNTSGGSTVATYQYDGRGRRIVKYIASIPETRHFYYAGDWQDIEERTGSSTAMDKQYVWGVGYVDELVCRDDTTQRLYATQDANFNLTSIMNSSGGVVERYLFDPYGNRTVMNGSWGIISSSAFSWVIGHQGLLEDNESGLLYNRQRYLHPALGRFLRRDPIGYANDGSNFSIIATPEDQVIASKASKLLREFKVLAAQAARGGSRGTMVAKLNEARRFVQIAYGVDSEHYVLTRTLGLYEYVGGNPIENTDASGLQKQGANPPRIGHGPLPLPDCGKPQLQDNVCSVPPPANLLNCFQPWVECCKNHDRCYAANGCTAASWIYPWCGFITCQLCNGGAVSCVSTLGLLGLLDPKYGKPVAPSTQPSPGFACPFHCL
jgi:RHS repeat-associated protein